MWWPSASFPSFWISWCSSRPSFESALLLLAICCMISVAELIARRSFFSRADMFAHAAAAAPASM